MTDSRSIMFTRGTITCRYDLDVWGPTASTDVQSDGTWECRSVTPDIHEWIRLSQRRWLPAWKSGPTTGTATAENGSFWSEGYAEEIVIPLWIPAAITLPFAPREMRKALATRRMKRICCPHCNYSRVGISPDAPCPECGKSSLELT